MISPGCSALATRATSLIGFERQGLPVVDPEPRWAPELTVAIQQQAAYARDLLSWVHAHGIGAANDAIEQARRGLDLVVAALAAPDRPLELEVSAGDVRPEPRACAEVQASRETGRKALEYHRSELRAWHAAIAAAARRPERTGWRVTSGYLALAMALGGVGLLGVAAGVIRWGRRAWIALRQVAIGTQAFIDASPREATDLKRHLRESTDMATRTAVDRIKRSMGR
jgi:hypothetical protein